MPFSLIVPLVLVLLLGPFAILPKAQPVAEPTLNPQQLVQAAVQNGLNQTAKGQVHWCYREAVDKEGAVETRELCQTSAGDIDRMVAINGQSLSYEQQKREDERIRRLLANPAELRRQKLRQEQDAANERRMFAMFPIAFRYQYDGTERGLVKLRFEPNPSFEPVTRQDEVFHHLEGTMLIDPEQKRFAQSEGRLTSEVRFLGGLLGHLDKGGIFAVTFKEVESGDWETVSLNVHMIGRALLFKTISVQEEREFENYRSVPANITLRQAAELLEKSRSEPGQTVVSIAQ
jgi:hypothetical protein